MKTLKDLITEFEGDELKPYICPAGFNSIGRGYNFDANPLPNDIASYLKTHGEITQEMSDRLLDESIMDAMSRLIVMFPVESLSWSINRYNALISVMFNVGLGNNKKGFRSFKKMIAAIKAGDWETASKELLNSKRTKQVGERAEIEAQMLREG